MNIKSITASWLIALCLLGVFSLMKQPGPAHNAKETVITLPQDVKPQTEAELNELEAKAWCALDSDQIALVDYLGKKHTLKGGMAIAPEWDGTEFDAEQQQRLTSCLDQRRAFISARNGDTPQLAALDYLFTQL